MTLPKVTFAFVNCNRLFYLKSSFESFSRCTKDYPNTEWIIIDNASVEDGTAEYLEEKKAQGVHIVRKDARSPSTEYAEALNTIVEQSTGDYIAIIPGDMQCVVDGKWLEALVQTAEKLGMSFGCAVLDAQRAATNRSHRYGDILAHESGCLFAIDLDRYTIVPCGGAFYSKKIIEKYLYPWSRDLEAANLSNLEVEKAEAVKKQLANEKTEVLPIIPIIPPAVSIYTDARGVSAKVRRNKRYGNYWEAKQNHEYYKVHSFDDLILKHANRQMPVSIEEIVETVGWDAPIDSRGAWIKGSLDMSNAEDFGGVELAVNESIAAEPKEDVTSPGYLADWLNDA